MDASNTSFLLGWPIFRGYVSFKEGTNWFSPTFCPSVWLPQDFHLICDLTFDVSGVSVGTRYPEPRSTLPGALGFGWSPGHSLLFCEATNHPIKWQMKMMIMMMKMMMMKMMMSNLIPPPKLYSFDMTHPEFWLRRSGVPVWLMAVFGGVFFLQDWINLN